MPSDVDICNLALSQLGDATITNLDEGSTRANLCKLWYPVVRDDVLRKGQWKFARRRATLNRLEAAPVFGYAFAYQLPTDPYCLQVLALDGDETDAWTVEGRQLLTDATSANITYIARVIDAGSFDGECTLALVQALAAQLAYAITGSHTAQQLQAGLFADQLREARLANGREGSPQGIPVPDMFTRVR